uniref:ESPR domain-containing protein n=1 Tax=Acinetobacter pittii TaxID=48296 RepID=UPI0030090476
MNKIYRMIWSVRFGTWIAVSELSRSKTKSTIRGTLIGSLIISGGLLDISPAFAGYEAGGGSTYRNCITNKTGATAGSGTEAQNAVAIGAIDSSSPTTGQACAPTTGSVAIGAGASTAGVTPANDNTQAGANTANYNQAISIGQNSTASGDQSIALGANTLATGHSSVAIGGDDVDRAAAISGAEYTALTGDTLPTGPGTYKSTTASGSSAVALGMQNDASGTFSTAIGTRSEASGLASIAMGTRAQATQTGAISIGAVSKASKEGAVALGNNTTSSGEDAVAIGSNTTADQDRAVSIGQGATSSTVGGVALGAGSKVNSENSAAIGQNSVATAQTGDSFLTKVAASDKNGTVSVGDVGKERRIQNVSDGAADTDAVNVAQLKKLKNINDQQGTSTAQGLGGGSTYDSTTGAVSAPAYTVNGTAVNNVGAAISELDKGWTLQSNGANAGAVKAGDTVDVG